MWKTLHPAPDLSRHGCSPFRQIAESFVLLAVAVVVFRGFGVEGYLISTGSMAPTLLGYHHRITCPECSFVYARGTDMGNDVEIAQLVRADLAGDHQPSTLTRCPNCGYQGVVTSTLPRTEGDQLLVHKHAYEFRDPRRWEVIVFRNPGDPRQAYVKRVAGLPGERLRIQDGNVFINDALARKSYDVIRAMCIPVSIYENQVETEDPDRQPGWVKTDPASSWTFDSAGLESHSAQAEIGSPISWIGYRHWIRSGGTHVTDVPLTAWPRELAPLNRSTDILRYENGRLRVRGVLTEFDRNAWRARSDAPDFQQAIERLFEQSHQAPIEDEYAYNAGEESAGHPVNEFLISLSLSEIHGNGRFEIELSDGENIFSAVFRFDSRRVELLKNGDPVPVRSAVLDAALLRNPARIDFGLVDHQAVLAVNQREVVPPFPYERKSPCRPMRKPVRFGAAELDCRVTHLGLFRDVHYTSFDGQADREWTLGPDEFFVLGDNSPVSVDSRAWEDPAVPRSALIGKPLVVHLPSRSRRIRWNGQIHDLRLPDFSRARLVR